eukprot:6456364-Amphidinium_carterae.1
MLAKWTGKAKISTCTAAKRAGSEEHSCGEAGKVEHLGHGQCPVWARSSQWGHLLPGESKTPRWDLAGRHLEVCDYVRGTVAVLGACRKRGWAVAEGGPQAVLAVGRKTHLVVPKCHVQQGSVLCRPGDRHVEPVQRKVGQAKTGSLMRACVHVVVGARQLSDSMLGQGRGTKLG